MRGSGRGRRAGRGSGRPFACHCMHGKKNKIARLIESVYTYTVHKRHYDNYHNYYVV